MDDQEKEVLPLDQSPVPGADCKSYEIEQSGDESASAEKFDRDGTIEFNETIHDNTAVTEPMIIECGVEREKQD